MKLLRSIHTRYTFHSLYYYHVRRTCTHYMENSKSFDEISKFAVTLFISRNNGNRNLLSLSFSYLSLFSSVRCRQDETS